MRSMIYGAGSLGTILGALLSEKGEDVVLVSRNREHIEALKKNGARITGGIDKTIRVKAAVPEEICESFDVIILMTKQLENALIAKKLRPFLGDSGAFCCMQNGIPEYSVRGIISDEKIVSGVVPWSASFRCPGVSELTSPGDSVRFTAGCPFQYSGTALDNVVSVLSKAGRTEIDDDVISMRWSKLLVNASVSAFSSSLGLPCGGVTHNGKYQRICLRIMNECIAVGKAEGVRFRPVNDYPLADALWCPDERMLPEACAKLPEAFESIKRSESSILQDLRRGRKTEIHALNGVVCETGKKLGIPAPFNAKVVDTIEKIENGELVPSEDNIINYHNL